MIFKIDVAQIERKKTETFIETCNKKQNWRKGKIIISEQ